MLQNRRLIFHFRDSELFHLLLLIILPSTIIEFSLIHILRLLEFKISLKRKDTFNDNNLGSAHHYNDVSSSLSLLVSPQKDDKKSEWLSILSNLWLHLEPDIILHPHLETNYTGNERTHGWNVFCWPFLTKTKREWPFSGNFQDKFLPGALDW